MSEWIKKSKKICNKIGLSQVDKTSLYLCIIERDVKEKKRIEVKLLKLTDMSKEVKNWIDSLAEIEALIMDLDLEFVKESTELWQHYMLETLTSRNNHFLKVLADGGSIC